MTPFPHLKKAIQEAGVNPGIQEISEEIRNFKGDFFLDTLFKVQISLRTHAAASEPIFSRQINTGIRSIYFFPSS